MITLSNGQQQAHDALLAWWEAGEKQTITLGGYAGTGKTTLIGRTTNSIRQGDAHIKVAFCCYTGKASRVLREKLEAENALKMDDHCGTVHSLIYEPQVDDKGDIVDWMKMPDIPHDLIVIDEASMIDEVMWRDLRSFHRRIIAVGDHGQLPPIKGNFNLMGEPEYRLEEIHRQAEGNPIIALSMLARTEGHIPFGVHGEGVEKLHRGDDNTTSFLDEHYSCHDPDTMVLCGFNKTRIALNQRIRTLLGFGSEALEPGERVICLRNNRNAKKCQIFNGMLGTAATIKLKNKGNKFHWYKATIDMDGERKPYKGLINRYQVDNKDTVSYVKGLESKELGDLFDRGYALTVHKAQGSECRKVILHEEPCQLWQGEMWKRWLYTAVTRAQEELYIVA
jgi:exodeoxyribonuclease-5